jgi:hypothetical protein
VRAEEVSKARLASADEATCSRTGVGVGTRRVTVGVVGGSVSGGAVGDQRGGSEAANAGPAGAGLGEAATPAAQAVTSELRIQTRRKRVPAEPPAWIMIFTP